MTGHEAGYEAVGHGARDMRQAIKQDTGYHACERATDQVVSERQAKRSDTSKRARGDEARHGVSCL